MSVYSLIQEKNDPHFNLAAEEYLLHERSDDFIILSVNSPSVIIGKHQVANREVNSRFTDKNNIPVIRRISGGGAVYHDTGNLNFAFIRQSEQGKQVDFRLYTQPVIDFLKSLGIDAIFDGKNDLTIDGLKISGNAEHVFRERVLHHGTLLFNASLDSMRQALKPENDNYSSRGVESNRADVTNLSPRLPEIETVEQFMSEMLKFFTRTLPDLIPFKFSDHELEKIHQLIESRYKEWEWNWGYGPPYIFSAKLNLFGKPHSCRFLVKDGIIWESDIEGSSELSSGWKKLIGCRHMYEDIRNRLYTENIAIPDEDIYNLF